MFEAFGKSLIDAKIKSGPRVEPRGIPQDIVLRSDCLPWFYTLQQMYLVHLISVLIFHFRCLCLIRTMNVYRKELACSDLLVSCPV